MELPNDQYEAGEAAAASGNDPVKIGVAIFGGLVGGVLIARVVGGLVRMGVRMFGSAIASEVLRKPAGSREVVREGGEPSAGGGGVARAAVSEVEVGFGGQGAAGQD